MAKVMISLPDELLSAADGLARRQHRSRSELIREALREVLARETGEGAGSVVREAALGAYGREARLRLAFGRLEEWRRRNAKLFRTLDPVELVRRSRASR
jgi:predicted transcriptional regulator